MAPLHLLKVYPLTLNHSVIGNVNVSLPYLFDYLHSWCITENPNNKVLEHYVVHSNNNNEPRDINEVKISHGSLQSDWMLVLFHS